jgi:hypothetical protein
MDTLEAPRLPAAHHPSTESDTPAFCPPRMGRKLTRNGPPSIRPVISPVIHPNRTEQIYMFKREKTRKRKKKQKTL